MNDYQLGYADAEDQELKPRPRSMLKDWREYRRGRVDYWVIKEGKTREDAEHYEAEIYVPMTASEAADRMTDIYFRHDGSMPIGFDAEGEITTDDPVLVICEIGEFSGETENIIRGVIFDELNQPDYDFDLVFDRAVL